MKVVLQTFSFTAGGPQKWILELLPHLAPLVEAVGVVSYSFGPASNPLLDDYRLPDNCRSHHIVFDGSFLQKRKLVYWHLPKELASFRGYHVWHANSDDMDGPFLLAASRLGIPVRISHARNSAFFRPRLYSRLLHLLHQWLIARYGNHFFGVSANCRSVLHRFVPAEIPYIVEPSGLNPGNLQRSLSSPQDTPAFTSDCLRLCHVGRFNPQKNHGFLFAVFERVLERIPRARLTCIGSGPTMDEFQGWVSSRRLDSKVNFIPFCRNIPGYLHHHCDAMLLPSLWEGTPRVALEAQAVGVPVFASDRITPEIDLSLGLFSQLPIDQGQDAWITALEALDARLDQLRKRPMQFDAARLGRFHVGEQAARLVAHYRRALGAEPETAGVSTSLP